MKNLQVEIIVLEDDLLTTKELSDCLVAESWVPTVARSIKQFRQLIEHHEYQLLIIDIGLPDGSGLDVIRAVRDKSSVGIIVISGQTEEADVVTAIELGADDYLKKPISTRELRAKIRRLLHRTDGVSFSKHLVRSQQHECKIFSDWTLDIDNHRLIYKKSQDIDLTDAEYKLLRALVNNSDRILSRCSLLNHLHTVSGVYDERTIDGIISRLRRKLAKKDSYKPIKTVRNSGYMFCDHVQTEYHELALNAVD